MATKPKYLCFGMKHIKNETLAHDLYLEPDGNLAMAFDSKEISQLVRQRLQTYYGEWVLDPKVGVEWIQRVFVRPPNEMVAESLIKKCILETKGVTGMQAFDMTIRQPRRELSVVNADIVTVFDEVEEVRI
jgi:hypothetical protein